MKHSLIKTGEFPREQQEVWSLNMLLLEDQFGMKYAYYLIVCTSNSIMLINHVDD